MVRGDISLLYNNWRTRTGNKAGERGYKVMQAQLTVYCEQCGEYIGSVKVDTADMPEELQAKVNAVILGHRGCCPYYKCRG